MNAPAAASKSLKTLLLQAPSFDGFDWDMMKRRLREGVEFFRLQRARAA